MPRRYRAWIVWVAAVVLCAGSSVQAAPTRANWTLNDADNGASYRFDQGSLNAFLGADFLFRLSGDGHEVLANDLLPDPLGATGLIGPGLNGLMQEFTLDSAATIDQVSLHLGYQTATPFDYITVAIATGLYPRDDYNILGVGYISPIDLGAPGWVQVSLERGAELEAGVGYYLTAYTPATLDGGAGEPDATPEPATFGLMAALSGSLLMGRRRGWHHRC